MQRLVARADLAAAADDAAGERHDHAGHGAHRLHRRFRRRAAWPRRPAARIRMLPPPTAGWTPNRSSTRNSPSITGMRQIAAAVEHLADLVAVAEEAQLLRRPPLVSAAARPSKQAVVGQVRTHWPTRSTSRLPSALGVHREQQHAHAGPPVGRLVAADSCARCRPRTCSRSPRWRSRSSTARPRQRPLGRAPP